MELTERKGDMFDVITRFVTREEKQLHVRAKHIRRNGRQFGGDKLTQWFNTKGIILETAAPYTYEQNGLVCDEKGGSLVVVVIVRMYHGRYPRL